MRNFQGEDLTEHQCLDIIFNSLMNGQRRQAARQIKEYGIYDFVDDFRQYLLISIDDYQVIFGWYTDALLCYVRLQGESDGN